MDSKKMLEASKYFDKAYSDAKKGLFIPYDSIGKKAGLYVELSASTIKGITLVSQAMDKEDRNLAKTGMEGKFHIWGFGDILPMPGLADKICLMNVDALKNAANGCYVDSEDNIQAYMDMKGNLHINIINPRIEGVRCESMYFSMNGEEFAERFKHAKRFEPVTKQEEQPVSGMSM